MNGVQKNGVQLNGVQLNRVQNFVSICNVSNYTVSKCTAPLKSGHVRTGAEVSAFLRRQKAVSLASVQTYRAFLQVSGAAIVEKSAMKRRYHDATPRNWRTCLRPVGVGQAIALTFEESVRIPCRSTMCPKYFKPSRQKWHLSAFSRNLAARRRRKTSARCSRCFVKGPGGHHDVVQIDQHIGLEFGP
ncbi:abc transporter permease [Lasius niger]|uniref:Abc transporter permease n=1 Tax=Lasius niger TaxID=67767 RepID=A0A0J7NFD0_LASNI|nr:abc transporter permease [Lasius niger]